MGDRNDWLGAAAFRLERGRGIPSSGGWFDNLVAEFGLDDASPADVEDQIVHLIESGTLDADDRHTAYWALGKCGHSGHVPFLRNRLALAG
jgi:hypothetical protein